MPVSRFSHLELFLRILPVGVFLTATFSVLVIAADPLAVRSKTSLVGNVLSVSSSSTAEKSEKFVKGEVLVRFRPSTTTTQPFQPKTAQIKPSPSIAPEGPEAEIPESEPGEGLIPYADLDAATVPQGLKEVNKSIPIKAVERVFQGLSETPSSPVIDVARTVKVTFDGSISVEQVVQVLKSKSDVIYAEPNYIGKAFFTPNDPYFLDRIPSAPERSAGAVNPWDPAHDYQWNLKQIRMPQAWDLSQGSSDIWVAVLDSVYLDVDPKQPDHEDRPLYLQHRYDGYSVYKYVIDPLGHGLHVLGIMGANTNNGKGVAGVAPESSYYLDKVVEWDGTVKSSRAAYAVAYSATKAQVMVINMSWGFENQNPPQVITDALVQANQAGKILVAAAGNSRKDIDQSRSFPASFEPVIAVGATDYNNQIATYSNYGLKLDLVAPGGGWDTVSRSNTLSLKSSCEGLWRCHIIGDQVDTVYSRLSGTSMAAPHVAGVAALVMDRYRQLHAGVFPTSQEVENIIKNSADDLGNPGFDPYYGYGRINAHRALMEMDVSDPAIQPLVRINYNSDFSSKYGQKNLEYLAWGAPTASYTPTGSYKLLIWSEAAKAWIYKADRNFGIRSETLSPAATYSPVIRWSPPSSLLASSDPDKKLRLTIMGYFKRTTTKAGIGKNDPRTIYEVKKNGTVVWTGSARAADPTRRLDYSLDLDLHVTDKIEFWVNANGDATGDQTELDFTIVVR